MVQNAFVAAVLKGWRIGTVPIIGVQKIVVRIRVVPE